jgi:hypothetical protein
LYQQPLILPSAAIVLRASRLVELRVFLLIKIMIKFEQEYETIVYLSDAGFLVVEQNDAYGQKESIIIGDKKRAYAVIRAMKIILQSAEFGNKYKEEEKA